MKIPAYDFAASQGLNLPRLGYVRTGRRARHWMPDVGRRQLDRRVYSGQRLPHRQSKHHVKGPSTLLSQQVDATWHLRRRVGNDNEMVQRLDWS